MKKKVLISVGVSLGIVAGAITGGAMYHNHQVTAQEEKLVAQQQEKKQSEKQQIEKEKLVKAKNATEELFADKEKKWLADDVTAVKIKETRELVEDSKQATKQETLQADLQVAENLASQVEKTRLGVQSLFKDNTKKTLTAGVDKTKIAAVKKQISENTPQKSAQKQCLNDANAAETIVNQQLVAQKVKEKEIKQKATEEQVATKEAVKQTTGDAAVKNEATTNNKTASSNNDARNENSQASGEKEVASAGKSTSNVTEKAPSNNGNTSSSSKESSNATSNTTPSNQPTVAKMNLASRTNQIITVVASGSSATVKFWEKSNGSWNQVFSTSGRVGSQGVGAADEYHSRTPRGAYSLGFAFGTSNPGTALSFRQITNKSYWISNVNDSQYNTWQERNSSNRADEHMASYPTQYKYGVVINYNTSRVAGNGSGFFLHCSNGAATAGCVAIPTSQMRTVLQKLHAGAYIVNVTSESELLNY